MSINTKFLGVAAVVAIAAFMLSRVIWPDLPDMAPPTAGQMPFFVFLSILESVAFGVGVSFLIFKWGSARETFRRDGWLPVLVFLSTAWLLLSWWPHDNIHRITPEGDYTGLLQIEYGFHVTLMIAAFIIAYYFWRYGCKDMHNQE